MSDPWPFVFVAIALSLSGALVSLVALLPPIRRLAQRSAFARTATLVALGLIALALGFSVWTRLTAEAIYTFGTMVMVDTFDPRAGAVVWPLESQKSAIVNELWVRLWVPPPWRQLCLAGDGEVCAVLEDLPPSAGANWTWSGYVRDVVVGSVSALTCMGIAWRFTRLRQSLPPAA